MKVLLVNTHHFYGGGDSTYTFNLAELLTNQGHEIAFFAMQDARNLPDPNTDLFVSPINFRDLNQNKNFTNSVKVFARTIYSNEARQKFSILLDRFSPDIVHLQNFFLHITPSIVFAAEQANIPMVWTLHDYWLVCPNSHFMVDRTRQICEACQGRHFYQAIFKRCKKDSLMASGMAALVAYSTRWMGILNKIDAFLTPSRFLRSKLLENGFSENKVHHLPLLLRQENFWEGTQDQGYILFLGKLEAIKGINVLIEAARKAKAVPLLIAGSVTEPFASQLPTILPENATYVGLKHGQALAELIKNSLSIVLPSIWFENQPFSILEAFAAGKPVIASNLGGMTELVAHQERGLLVEPGNPDALADAMQWAVTHQKLMREMGQTARHYALENHSPSAHYKALNKIYSNLPKRTTIIDPSPDPR